MKNKSIAFLFSGQLRKINFELFKKSLALFIGDQFHYGIFITTWDSMGVSMNHFEENAITFNDNNLESYINEMFEGFNVINKFFYNYKEWQNNLSSEFYQIQNTVSYSFVTKNSLAQLYLIQQSYLQVPNLNDYDFFIRLRFDSIFVFNLNEYLNKSFIYHLNFGKAFYPNRVYDILFVAHREYAPFIFQTYSKIPQLINSDFDNGLEKRDACRLLYLSVAGLEVPPNIVTLKYRYCDIYRDKMLLLDYLIKVYLWDIAELNDVKSKFRFLTSIFSISFPVFIQFLLFLLKSRIKNFISK